MSRDAIAQPAWFDPIRPSPDRSEPSLEQPQWRLISCEVAPKQARPLEPNETLWIPRREPGDMKEPEMWLKRWERVPPHSP